MYIWLLFYLFLHFCLRVLCMIYRSLPIDKQIRSLFTGVAHEARCQPHKAVFYVRPACPVSYCHTHVGVNTCYKHTLSYTHMYIDCILSYRRFGLWVWRRYFYYRTVVVSSMNCWQRIDDISWECKYKHLRRDKEDRFSRHSGGFLWQTDSDTVGDYAVFYRHVDRHTLTDRRTDGLSTMWTHRSL